MKWVLSGIRAGIRTSTYPGAPETAAGVTPAARSSARGYALVLIPVRMPLKTHFIDRSPPQTSRKLKG